MAKVAKFAAGTTLSIRAFCEQARKDRETVANRVRAARIAPVDKRGGYDVYLLGDLLDAVFIRDDSGQIDPARLPPFERKAHYQAEHEMLTLQTARAELVPRIEVEQEQARLMKIVAQCFDTLPDLLERDCAASSQMVATVERRLDRVREELYKLAVELEANAASTVLQR
jgi:hypothetical protein